MRLSDIGNIRCKASTDITYPLPSRPTAIKLLYFPHFSIFFLFQKVNACKRKANCAHKKASKHRLKVSLFAPCCEKSALNAGAFLCAFFLPVIKNPILLSASSFAAQNRCVPAFLWAAPRDPGNAAPQYLARGSPLVARHIRPQTRRSLNECATSPKRRRWRMKRGDVGEKQGA